MRAELIRATELLRTGPEPNLNEALGLLQDTVYSFSMKLCGHPEDAEDTAQEVLVRSLPHLSKLRDPKAMSVWLYTVAKNRCWRMRRKPANAPSRMLSLDELMPDETELERLLADSRPSPEAQASQSQEAEHLQAAILTLPPQYRLILVLHDMEELDTDIVAQILSLKPGTVRVRLHRARLALRKELAHAESSAGSAGDRRSSRPARCREVFASLSELVDGRLEEGRLSHMRKHIESCAPCVAFLDDLRQAIDRCRNSESPCTPEVQKRLRSLAERERGRIAALSSAKISSQL